ncbi:MAG: hypothetical protein IJN07_03295, partial [Clostridia bacterium]|nr:hypothetical protein [Clostridia bacterium]
MFKRVGSIVLTVVMMFTMVCSTFALATPLSLAVRVEDADSRVVAGETLKVYVDLVGNASLSAITICGTYNTELFDLQAANIVPAVIDEMIATPILDTSKTENQIKVNWFGFDNVALGSGNLLELTFTAKTPAEEVETSFSFAFPEDGLTHVLAGNPTHMTPGTDFLTDNAISETITVTPTAPAPITPSTLFTSVNKDRVEVGETVEVAVQVNDYQDNWAGLVV